MPPRVHGRRDPGRRRAGILAVLLLTGGVPQARAQETTAPPTPWTLSLESISPWIDDERPLRIAVRIRNAAEAPRTVRLETTLLQPVTSRSELAAIVDGTEATPFATVGSREIAVTTSRVVRFRASRRALGTPALGIYPLAIRLADDSGTLLEARTAVPVVADAPSTRLPVLSVLDLVDSDPPIRLEGGYDPATIDTDALRLGAERAEAFVRARPLVSVDGASLEAAADLADGALTRTADGRISDLDATSPTALAARRWANAVRALADAGGAATSSYVPIDLDALGASRASSRIRRQFRRGTAALRDVLGADPVNTLVAPELRARDRFPVGTAVVPASAIAATEGAPFSPDLFGVSTPLAIEDLRVLVADERLTAVSQGTTGALLSAQTLVAETALRWLELPLAAEERLLVFLADRAAPPRTLAHIAASFAEAPWLDPVLPPDAGTPRGTATVAPDDEPVRTLSLAIPAASRAVRALRSVLPEDASEIALARVDEWETALLIAERVTGDGVGDPALADAVRADADAHLDRLRAATRSAAITLTSRQGEIPIVLENGNDFAVDVRVHLSGRRITFPDGAAFPTRLEPGDTTLDVPVEVLGQGRFPLEISIVTPSGIVLTTNEVQLRSTGVSRVATVVVGGALLFLFAQAFWRRRARGRR